MFFCTSELWHRFRSYTGYFKRTEKNELQLNDTRTEALVNLIFNVNIDLSNSNVWHRLVVNSFLLELIKNLKRMLNNCFRKIIKSEVQLIYLYFNLYTSLEKNVILCFPDLD